MERVIGGRSDEDLVMSGQGITFPPGRRHGSPRPRKTIGNSGSTSGITSR